MPPAMSTPITNPVVLSLLCFLFATTACSKRSAIILRDVSRPAGLDYSIGPQKSYGGPSIADLDDDGYPDLMFTHHDSCPAEIYFNTRNGTFVKSPFRFFDDIHAINAFRYSPASRTVHFAISRGGAYGRKPSNVRVYRVNPDRSITHVTRQAGMAAHNGRGRSVLFLSLRGPGRSPQQDFLSLNGEGLNRRVPHHVAFRNRGKEPAFSLKPARGYGRNRNWYGAPVDFDNDGKIDIVSFETLRFHNVSGPFQLTDVTDAVLPRGVRPVAVVSIAELDFDNDGLWDLYVATTSTGDLRWRWYGGRRRKDYLLRNVGGRYVDVTAQAGIPQDGQTRGVAVGDLDNDGRMDIVLSKYYKRGVVLRNLGGGRFEARRKVIPRRLSKHVPGDGVQAFDYDLDGRLDVLLSEGDGISRKLGGFYRLFRNVSPRGDRHYLLVRVRGSPLGTATAMHAVVRIRVGRTWMRRRVGPSGVSVSIPLIETVHFGLGAATVIDYVAVHWVDGAEHWLKDVAVDQKLTVGRP